MCVYRFQTLESKVFCVQTRQSLVGIQTWIPKHWSPLFWQQSEWCSGDTDTVQWVFILNSSLLNRHGFFQRGVQNWVPFDFLCVRPLWLIPNPEHHCRLYNCKVASGSPKLEVLSRFSKGRRYCDAAMLFVRIHCDLGRIETLNLAIEISCWLLFEEENSNSRMIFIEILELNHPKSRRDRRECWPKSLPQMAKQQTQGGQR